MDKKEITVMITDIEILLHIRKQSIMYHKTEAEIIESILDIYFKGQQ